MKRQHAESPDRQRQTWLAEPDDGRPADTLPAGDGRPPDPRAGGLPAAEVASGRPAGPDGSHPAPTGSVEPLLGQWHDAQSLFVDDPAEAVVRARTLLTDLVRLVADQLDECGRRPGAKLSTEDLRQELRRYRDVFDKLVDVWGPASVIRASEVT